MAIFGTYYITNMLRIMKWPRKQGVFGKQVYDVFIVDQTIHQMVEWAASIGAGNPKLAVKILAYAYRDRDWDSDDAPDIEQYVNRLNDSFKEKGLDLNSTAPHDILDPFQFGKHFKGTIPANAFSNTKTRSFLEDVFIRGLLYGLSHPHNYENWYANNFKDFENNHETYSKVGLGIDKLPSLDENYSNAADVIDLYQQEMKVAFPEVPKKLLNVAKKVRNTR